MHRTDRAPFLTWRIAVAGLLAVTALLKIHRLAVGIADSAPPDPITGIDMAPLTTGAAMIEVAIAAALFTAPFRGAAFALLIISAGFVGHGVLRRVYGIAQCPCLATELPWAWLNQNQASLAQAIAWWLLLSAVWWLLIDAREPANNPPTP